jgi:tetratricopeptide (TPR) repeat protein
VSEQHLYLALPFFLCFWMGILDKWKFKYAQLVPALFIVFFSVQTYRAAKYYDNEIIFYSKSLEADPYNLPIVFNLADSYYKSNKPELAIAVTGRIIAQAQEKPDIKESKYFPYIVRLHGELVKIVLGKP